jgi:hypothetical protein
MAIREERKDIGIYDRLSLEPHQWFSGETHGDTIVCSKEKIRLVAI